MQKKWELVNAVTVLILAILLAIMGWLILNHELPPTWMFVALGVVSLFGAWQFIWKDEYTMDYLEKTYVIRSKRDLGSLGRERVVYIQLPDHTFVFILKVSVKGNITVGAVMQAPSSSHTILQATAKPTPTN